LAIRVPPRPLQFEPAPYDATPVAFTSLDLSPLLQTAVADRGFVTTTPIQSAVFPAVNSGVDLVACAETGTGKTLAFLLPLMQRLLIQGPKPCTRVLVLAPTRELAVQIEDEFQGLAYHRARRRGVWRSGSRTAGTWVARLRRHRRRHTRTPAGP
jgi:ATP-dependent RNA helicase RhlE